MDETISYKNTPKSAQKYFSYLCQCFSLKDGVLYDKRHEFEKIHLLTLQPRDVCAYFNLKAFGTVNPDADTTPKQGRSSSLMFYKKAISYFMPNKLISWQIESGIGNPTKSIEVNNLVKKVQKMEVRKQGKQSQARRPLTLDEFKYLIEYLKERKENDYVQKYALPAICTFQFHLIARIDDTCHFHMRELQINNQYPFSLKARMCWLKNVMEEYQAPSQIVLGSNDPNFCVLLNIGLYLEMMYPENDDDQEGELLCFSISSSPDNSKARVGRILKEIFTHDEFKGGNINSWLGSHSLRKLAATHARRNGCSRDEIDLRGRWKQRRRIVDTYLDTTIPYPDAKVASSTCVGGPIKYELVRGSGLDDRWVAKNVVPNIYRSHHCKKTAIVLGKAILWAIFDPSTKELVDSKLRNRVVTEYERIRLLHSNQNPVKKISLIISGHEGQLFIDEINDPDILAEGDPQLASTDTTSTRGRNTTIEDANRKRRMQSAELQAVFGHLTAMKRQNSQLQTELALTKSTLLHKLKIISANINRIALIPAQISTSLNTLTNIVTNSPQHTPNTNPLSPSHFSINNTGETREQEGVAIRTEKAKLSKNPKSLYILWHEYEFGIGGRRAAKTFSRCERGKCRHTYSKRNIFWNLVCEMTRRGHTANNAIDEIYKVYGHKTSVTDILRKLQKDKREHHKQFL